MQLVHSDEIILPKITPYARFVGHYFRLNIALSTDLED